MVSTQKHACPYQIIFICSTTSGGFGEVDLKFFLRNSGDALARRRLYISSFPFKL
ncbi:hypothetical protein CL1_1322 [Thermococcus cleftensis]|uniref:Uncharacterized protein n=1 Tax=Thermococcus cleftensis (strain DSM 27260 / KACC 17922 / CL1) TaxID=163003 RepID=I3ZUY6_THECF|nr:hypothetical protein CL1_1322 [Thermococcus cleftensis]